jgi:hypothetical protein
MAGGRSFPGRSTIAARVRRLGGGDATVRGCQEGVMLVRYPGRESGMSAIPFVISLFVVAGFAIAWYKTDQENTDLKSKVASAKVEAEGFQKKYEAVNNRLLELTEVTGFGDAEGKPDKAAITAALAGTLEKLRTSYTIEFTAQKYTATGQGGLLETIQGDKVKVAYIAAKDQLTNPTIQTALPIFEGAAGRMAVDVKRYVESNAAEMKSKAEMLASHTAAIGEKDTAYAGLRAEYDQSKRSNEETIRDLRDQVSNKDTALQQAQTETEAVKEEKDKAVAKLSGELNQKVAEIQTLVRREKPFISEGPDGEVVSAGSGLVIINRGTKDMLMPGTTFSVLGRIKGGALVPKGTLKVVRCNDQTAECRILQESGNSPITGGDLIQSPIYSPNRQMHFSFVGEFQKMGRSQAEARLKQLGAAVDGDVTPQTHYLVVGNAPAGEAIEDSTAWKRAREFGVTILTEAELDSFTMY